VGIVFGVLMKVLRDFLVFSYWVFIAQLDVRGKVVNFLMGSSNQ